MSPNFIRWHAGCKIPLGRHVIVALAASRACPKSGLVPRACPKSGLVPEGLSQERACLRQERACTLFISFLWIHIRASWESTLWGGILTVLRIHNHDWKAIEPKLRTARNVGQSETQKGSPTLQVQGVASHSFPIGWRDLVPMKEMCHRRLDHLRIIVPHWNAIEFQVLQSVCGPCQFCIPDHTMPDHSKQLVHSNPGAGVDIVVQVETHRSILGNLRPSGHLQLEVAKAPLVCA